VDRHGLVKISDWGLVKSTLNIESTTRGIVKGTPGYIAPEVWGGTRNFQPSVDLFAVGAMLYEVVVGKRLFRGRNLARIAEQVARRQPSEEAGHVSERCPALIPVLEKVLQRTPDRRDQVALDLADDLRGVRDSLALRENFKSFVRTVRPTLERVAPRGRHSGESGRPSPRISEPRGGVPTPSGVVPGPVSLGPPSPPVAVAEPPPEPQAPPPTRAMAPSRQVSDTIHSPRISVEEARTKALPPITKGPSPRPAPPDEPSAGGSMPAPVAVQRHRAPTAGTGRGAVVKEKPKKKRRKVPRGGTKPRKGKRRAPVRAAAVRPPPPTSAVVVVMIGLLILLVGLLVTFLR
jgi:serine/threonine-protein kinase